MCLRLGLKDQDIAYKLENLLITLSRIISIMDKNFICKLILEEARWTLIMHKQFWKFYPPHDLMSWKYLQNTLVCQNCNRWLFSNYESLSIPSKSWLDFNKWSPFTFMSKLFPGSQIINNLIANYLVRSNSQLLIIT